MYLVRLNDVHVAAGLAAHVYVVPFVVGAISYRSATIAFAPLVRKALTNLPLKALLLVFFATLEATCESLSTIERVASIGVRKSMT